MFDISIIPEEVRKTLAVKEPGKGEFLSYGKNGKVGFLLSGEVQAVRYQDGEKLLFPNILGKGDLVGITPVLLDTGLDFELEVKSDSRILEIPVEIFRRYLQSDPAVEIGLLKKISLNLLHSTRSFFIRIHGGTKAYLAYLLHFYTENEDEMRFDRYTEIGEIIFSSRMMVYRIIKEFEDRNILEKRSKVLIVKDRDELKTYFEKYI